LEDSGFNLNSAPLVFIRLVGFTTADAMRLVKAAQLSDENVRWRLAPAGVQADVYLAHARSVVRGQAPSSSGDSSSGFSLSSTQGRTQLYVDAKGLHKSHPVCMLGSAATEPIESDSTESAPLLFPQALLDLKAGLERLERELIGLRMMYVLGRTAWEQRHLWKTHRLHLSHNARLVAVIEPHIWRAHLLNTCNLDALENAVPLTVPKSSGFAAPGFDALSLETALWEFAKRCPEALLSKMVPTAYLQAPLTHRRLPELSERALGDHCVAILRSLDTQSRTADDLQNILRLSRPALLRALASLALTRAIHPEPRPQGIFHWLQVRLRRRGLGAQSLF
jgi:hypothetical protein